MAYIGSLITISNVRNGADLELPFYGINRDKEFVPTVAATDGLDRKNYKVVTKGRFVFSGMQTGRDMCIRIGLYNNDFDCLVSPAYTTFDVTSEAVLPEYLFMFFNSEEKNRYGAFLSDGSVRANLDWEVFCNIQIPLPGIEVQREYVAVYKAMQHNLTAMQNKLDDLKLVCDAYIEELKDTASFISVGKCIQIVDKFNRNRQFRKVYGVNIDKTIIPTNADVSHVDISRYKILDPGNIVFSGMQTGRDHTIRIAMNTGETPVIVSPAYTIFSIVSNDILPEYFMLWFLRSETDRLGWFLSDGSVRANLDIDRLFDDVEIPIPPVEVQKSIVAIYDVYNRRKQYAERLRQMINEMCPILVAASVGNTAVAAAHS